MKDHITYTKFFSILNLLLLSILPMCTFSQTLFNQDSLKLISRQFSFTEGPAVNSDGDVYFTDQPNNKIWKYGTNGKLVLFRDQSGRSNGMYFDSTGNLISCADENNEIWSFDKEGREKVILSDVAGKKLNGPNDLWIDSKGGIYFTDPYYQRDYWKRKVPEMDGQKVYYLPARINEKVRVVADDLHKPNGIVGSADGKHLFVADIEGNSTYRYNIGADGSLSHRVKFIDQGSDGITIDRAGNLYLTGKGVFIFNSEGKKIGHIKIDEPWTANVCFAGKNRDILFITASSAIYTIPMHIQGL